MTARSRSGRGSLTLLVCAIALIIGLVTASSSQAADPRPSFQMPFPCGEVWQGATYPGHWINDYPLDFNRSANEYGATVVASAAGVVSGRGTSASGANYVIIRHNATWSTDYRHLSAWLVNVGDTVAMGTPIGRVGNSGNVSTHLHYAQRADNVPAYIYFDGAPLNPPYSYSYNGPSYTSRNCGGGGGGGSVPRRLGFGRSDGALFRVEPGGWQQMAGPGASSVAVDGQAMAMIVPWQGAIYRLNDSSPWVTIRNMSSRPTSVAVADNGRLAFSADDGAWFRACNSCVWQQMAGPGASSVAVDGQAMAMIVPWQGAIYRDSDSSPWVTITGPSSQPTSVGIAG